MHLYSTSRFWQLLCMQQCMWSWSSDWVLYYQENRCSCLFLTQCNGASLKWVMHAYIRVGAFCCCTCSSASGACCACACQFMSDHRCRSFSIVALMYAMQHSSAAVLIPFSLSCSLACSCSHVCDSDLICMLRLMQAHIRADADRFCACSSVNAVLA